MRALITLSYGKSRVTPYNVPMQTKASGWLGRTWTRVPRVVRIPFTISWLLALVSGLMVISTVFRLQPTIPLFYSLALPDQQLVSRQWLWMFPALCAGITSIHTAVVTHLYQHHDLLLTKLWSWSTVVVLTLFVTTLARILIIIN